MISIATAWIPAAKPRAVTATALEIPAAWPETGATTTWTNAAAGACSAAMRISVFLGEARDGRGHGQNQRHDGRGT
jgi:hypothetical protein